MSDHVGVMLRCFTLSFLVVLSAISQAQEIKRIGLLGCHRQDEPAPALARYVEVKPDLCLWVGDNVYADTENDPKFIEQCYQNLESKPAFRQLREASVFLPTWDDHDYGLNNEGKNYPLKEASKELFRKFWKMEEAIPADQPGVYHARTFSHAGHTLQVILLDCRYNRDDPSETGDTLGEAQWKWLEEQLEQPADLRLIVSGYQVLLDNDSVWETWGKFPGARERLYELVRSTGAEGVVFITGDQHYGEVLRVPEVFYYDAIEIMFAGINQTEPPDFTTLRVSPVSSSTHSLALIDVQWEADAYHPPHLLFTIRDAMLNQLEVTYRINLAELRSHLSIQGEREFLDETTVTIDAPASKLTVRYTLDGSEPNASSTPYEAPFAMRESATVKARYFDSSNRPRDTIFERPFKKLTPREPVDLADPKPGLSATYVEGVYKNLPNFGEQTPKWKGITATPSLDLVETRDDHFAIRWEGYVRAPRSGLYTFTTNSDDGSRLSIHGEAIVNNDGSHSIRAQSGKVALLEGWHPIIIDYFEDNAGEHLEVLWEGPDLPKELVAAQWFAVSGK